VLSAPGDESGFSLLHREKTGKSLAQTPNKVQSARKRHSYSRGEIYAFAIDKFATIALIMGPELRPTRGEGAGWRAATGRHRKVGFALVHV
jgi:hypothetical protein